jgi:hypothetical protein
MGIIALVFAIGLCVRAASYFNTAKTQRDEILKLLTEIRDKR